MNGDNSIADDLKRQAANFYNSTERFVLNAIVCQRMWLLANINLRLAGLGAVGKYSRKCRSECKGNFVSC